MSVSIKIDGEGLQYATATTIIKASQVIAFLNADTGLSSSSLSNGEPLQLSSSVASYNKAPREFLIESSAKTNAQKILAFAKYHAEKNTTTSFDITTIKNYFKKAGEPEPKNFSRDLKDAILQLYIYETDDVGQYSITEHGEQMLSSGFASEPKKQPSKKRPTSSSRIGPSKSITDEIKELEITPKIEGIISYHALPTKGDKILWILYFGLQHDITEMTSADIEYIAGKLMDKIPTSNIAGLTEYNLKKAFMTKINSGKLKLLYDGVEYIKNKQIQS